MHSGNISERLSEAIKTPNLQAHDSHLHKTNNNSNHISRKESHDQNTIVDYQQQERKLAEQEAALAAAAATTTGLDEFQEDPEIAN